jgi:hypothetical protein
MVKLLLFGRGARGEGLGKFCVSLKFVKLAAALN